MKKLMQERARVIGLGPGNVAAVYGFKEDLALDAEVTLQLKGANESGLVYLFRGDLTVAQCQQRIAGIGDLQALAVVGGESEVELNLTADLGRLTLFNDGSGSAALSVVNLRFQCFEYVALHLHVPPHLMEERLPRRAPEPHTTPPATHTAEFVPLSAEGGYQHQ